MIINDLVKYYEQLQKIGKLGKFGWSIEAVGYGIVLRPDGSVEDIVDLRQEVQVGKKTKIVPVRRLFPERVPRSRNVASNFMMDTDKYLVDSTDINNKFNDAANLHTKLLSGCNSDDAQSVVNYFSYHGKDIIHDNILNEKLNECIKNNCNLTFLNEKLEYIVDNSEVMDVWDESKAKSSSEQSNCKACSVTGKLDTIPKIHGVVKGLHGAQSSGARLISCNTSCGESWGCENDQSAWSRIGDYAASGYVNAINYLLSNRNNNKYIGDTCILYWIDSADGEEEGLLGEWLFEGVTDEELDKYMYRIVQGKDVKDIDSTKVHVLGVTPNAARVSVRFYYTDEIEKYVSNIREHYERMNISTYSKEVGDYVYKKYSIYKVMMETINQAGTNTDSKISKVDSLSLVQSIINNQRYPDNIYYQILDRIHSENKISNCKAAFIKAYLLNNIKNTEGIEVALNESNNNKAYVLGRLLEVLDSLQYAANKSSNIKEKYLVAASTMPGVIFPMILQKAEHYIAKADNGDMYNRQIGELLDRLEGEEFPARFSTTEQGLFMLGCYQQEQQKFRNIAQAKLNNKGVVNNNGN